MYETESEPVPARVRVVLVVETSPGFFPVPSLATQAGADKYAGLNVTEALPPDRRTTPARLPLPLETGWFMPPMVVAAPGKPGPEYSHVIAWVESLNVPCEPLMLGAMM